MIRLALSLLLLAAPAGAETARVISGEHGAFTRIVVELPGPADWTVGRTAMGYAFSTRAEAQPAYDLSRVWTRISQDRLQALRADPVSGALQLTLACPCHVFPFEYRPGMIVLDIKDGPAPEGSAFEAPFQPGAMPKLVRLPPLRTGPQDYGWLDAARAADAPAAETEPLPLPTGTVSLDPLRDELLEQLSRGAADGVVDMALPGKPKRYPAEDRGELPWSQIRIGEMPGVTAGREAEVPETDTCIPEDSLAIANWGADRAPLDLLAEARAGLYGEFDAVDPEAMLNAIRVHLYLGFGAEAGQYVTLLEAANPPEEVARELPAYRSMARLIEGESDPGTPFAQMLSCDGPAALWAALAHSRLPVGRAVNADAVVGSFLALPPHLRRHLGEGLADRFQTSGNAEAARMIRNAMERTPEVPAAEVAQLDARADLEADRPADARLHAETAVAEGGNDPEGLILLVEAHFRDHTPVSAETVEALRAFAGTTEARDVDPRLMRALVLALGMSGEADEAFALAAGRDFGPDLWEVAAALAEDDAFLRHAVVPAEGPVPETSGEIAETVATRLIDLGFAEAALAWLRPVTPGDSEPRRRLAARAELARGDARAALQLLQGLRTEVDAALRAQALVQLGDLESARHAYHAAARPEDAARLLAWENDWTALQTEGSDPWAAAAAAADGVPIAPEAGPLARGAALLEGSADARDRLEALLSAVPPPDSTSY